MQKMLQKKAEAKQKRIAGINQNQKTKKGNSFNKEERKETFGQSKFSGEEINV